MDVNDLHALKTGKIDGWKYNHSVVSLGLLNMPSGWLNAADPFIGLGEGTALLLPSGQYPVYVTLADVSKEQDGSHLRQTYLSLVVADGTPARIVSMLKPEEPVFQDGEFYGIPVDAGSVGFVDAEAYRICMNNTDEDAEFVESWGDFLEDEDHCAEGAANIVMPKSTMGENIIMVYSGWGDGVYPVLVTLDSENRILGVHIDLLVDQREESASASSSVDGGGPGGSEQTTIPPGLLTTKEIARVPWPRAQEAQPAAQQDHRPPPPPPRDDIPKWAFLARWFDKKQRQGPYYDQNTG